MARRLVANQVGPGRPVVRPSRPRPQPWPGPKGPSPRTPEPPKLGWVRIVATRPRLTLHCRMGEDPPQITDGYGGWETVDRPRRPSLTVWRGTAPWRMTVSLCMDARGDENVEHVEQEIATLEQMGRAPGGTAPPPQVRVALPGSRPRTPDVDWVVEQIEWGAALRSRAGKRTRQFAGVTFLQFVADEHLENLSPARKHRKPLRTGRDAGEASERAARRAAGRAGARTHTVRKGETLRTIAAKVYGAAEKWKRIAAANGNIRDPEAVKPGRVLKIP